MSEMRHSISKESPILFVHPVSTGARQTYTAKSEGCQKSRLEIRINHYLRDTSKTLTIN